MDETTVDEWVIVWFPPNEAQCLRKFRTETAARSFAAGKAVAYWNPLMEHRRITMSVESKLVPLIPQPTEENQ